MKCSVKNIALKAIVAIFMLASTGLVHARSDLQAQVGLDILKASADDYLDDTQEKGPVLAVENYNLFSVFHTPLSLGFMWGGDVSFFSEDTLGSDFDGNSINFYIGPAIGVEVPKIIKLQVGIGYAMGVKTVDYEYTYYRSQYNGRYHELVSVKEDDSESAVSYGFMAEAQVKFMPGSIISPLIGYRYIYSVVEFDDFDLDVNSNNFYAGVCINLGR